MMTMEQKFYAMTMKTLVAEAEKLGVKIDKKGSKAKAVEKMLAALATATEEATAVEEQPAVNEPAAVATAVEEQPKKERKASTRKKTFEELVADIPAPGDVRFIKTKKGEVVVKMGTASGRVFRYTGCRLVVCVEKLVTGLAYQRKSYGFVLEPTVENMLAVFANYRNC